MVFLFLFDEIRKFSHMLRETCGWKTQSPRFAIRCFHPPRAVALIASGSEFHLGWLHAAMRYSVTCFLAFRGQHQDFMP